MTEMHWTYIYISVSINLVCLVCSYLSINLSENWTSLTSAFIHYITPSQTLMFYFFLNIYSFIFKRWIKKEFFFTFRGTSTVIESVTSISGRNVKRTGIMAFWFSFRIVDINPDRNYFLSGIKDVITLPIQFGSVLARFYVIYIKIESKFPLLSQ